MGQRYPHPCSSRQCQERYKPVFISMVELMGLQNICKASGWQRLAPIISVCLCLPYFTSRIKLVPQVGPLWGRAFSSSMCYVAVVASNHKIVGLSTTNVWADWTVFLGCLSEGRMWMFHSHLPKLYKLLKSLTFSNIHIFYFIFIFDMLSV